MIHVRVGNNDHVNPAELMGLERGFHKTPGTDRQPAQQLDPNPVKHLVVTYPPATEKVHQKCRMPQIRDRKGAIGPLGWLQYRQYHSRTFVFKLSVGQRWHLQSTAPAVGKNQ